MLSPSPTEMTVAVRKLTLATMVAVALGLVAWGTSTVAAQAARRKEHIIVDTEAHPDEEELKALAKGCDLLVLPSTPDALTLEALSS